MDPRLVGTFFIFWRNPFFILIRFIIRITHTNYFISYNILGNPVYEETALRALRAIWSTRSSLDLLGNHIDVQKAGIIKG